MRKLLIALLIIPILSLGCFVQPPATTGSATSGTKYDAAQDSRITTLEGVVLGPNGLQTIVGTLNTKVAGMGGGDTSGLNSRVSSLETRLATEEGKVAGITGGASVTVTDALATRIKALEDWKASASTGTGGTVPTTATGSVTSTTNPISIPQMYSSATGGGSNVFYTMHITNGSTTWQYVKPIITMNIAPSYSARSVTGFTITMSNGQCNLTGSIAAPTVATSSVGNFSISPNAGAGAIATSSLVVIPISGCNGTGEFQIGAGQVMDILIQVSNITSSDVTLWNITNSISARSM